MKCEVCRTLLEEYIDSELGRHEAEKVSAHLTTCASCASEFDALTAEQEIYARYDRALDISPSTWGAIAARTTAESHGIGSGSRTRLRDRMAGLFAVPSLGWSLAGALAVLIVAVAIGVAYLRMHRQTANPNVIVKVNQDEPPRATEQGRSIAVLPSKSDFTAALGRHHVTVNTRVKASANSNLP